MVDGYLKADKSFEFQTGIRGRTVLLVNSSDLDGRVEKYIINETAEEIISYIGRRITLSEMICELANKYDEEMAVVEKHVFDFFAIMEKKYGIIVRVEPAYSLTPPIKRRSERGIYPYGMMIELTSNCNFRCIHCYGGYESCKSYMTFESFTRIVDQIENLGFESVELTGGEITTHPKLAEMIQYLLNTKISKISLLTNGSLLTDEIINIIKNNADRIIVQIDLHGLTDEYLQWFMGISYYVEKNKSIIKRVAKIAKHFRVATVVTRRNLQQLEDIADWLYANGVKSYGVSLVIPEGRAIDCGEPDLFLNQDELHEFEIILDRINVKYPSFISVIDSFEDQPNCGCISNCISVASDGKIKMCAMDDGNTLSIPLGNAINDDIRYVFDANQSFVEELSKIQAPSDENENCATCENIAYCSRCLLRAFTVNTRNDKLCKWAAELPEQIKMFLKNESKENDV